MSNRLRTAICKGLSLCLSASIAFPPSLWANPTDGVVVGGDASISSEGSTVTIEQHTDKAIIDWGGFSIGAGELTNFIQLSEFSAVLNRVTGGDPSAIYGTLQANGQVFLINPNGILVGPGGVVDTQGFVASTLDVSNDAFLAGGELLFSGDSLAGVRNEGSISALGGNVVMIAHTVSNSGEINAANGTAALAAGSEVLYKPLDEERVFVQAGSDTSADVGVDQTGQIQAAAAELKAAGGNVYGLAVNNEGVVRADSVETFGGRIFLTADAGAVSNSGELTAVQGEQGGEVRIAADSISLEDGSMIEAADLLVTAGSEILLNTDIETSGNQTYTGPVILGGDRSLASYGGEIAFNGTVDSESYDDGEDVLSNNYSLSLYSDDSVSFNGAVGGDYALGELWVDASNGQIGLNADVATAYDQYYNGAVNVGGNSILNAGGGIYFGGTLDSSNLSDLTSISQGDTAFYGAVGQSSLGNLNVTAQNGGNIYFENTLDSDGAVTVNSEGAAEFWGLVGDRTLGGLNVTSGDYIWFYDELNSDPSAALSLNSASYTGFDYAVGAQSLGDLDITSGESIEFYDTLDSDGAVVVNSAGSLELSGAAGVRALGSLDVSADAISLNGGNVTTSGDQTYTGAVNLGTDSTLNALGTVTFNGPVTAGNLTVNGGAVAWNDVLTGADIRLFGTNLFMNGAIESTGENGVLMVAENSFNNLASGGISVTEGARWLIYSAGPTLDFPGGLSGGEQFSTTYAGGPVPSFEGNGFLYSSAAPEPEVVLPPAPEPTPEPEPEIVLVPAPIQELPENENLANFQANLGQTFVDPSGGDTVVVDQSGLDAQDDGAGAFNDSDSSAKPAVDGDLKDAVSDGPESSSGEKDGKSKKGANTTQPQPAPK